MEFFKIDNYIKYFDLCIRQEKTGPAAEFAQKLGVSERTLRNHIQQLREIGVEIEYDYYSRTYKYSRKGKLKFGFEPEELKSIKGGKLCNLNSLELILINFTEQTDFENFS